MKSEKLLNAFGQIDDDLINEAADIRAKIIHFPQKIRKLTAIAACIVLMISIGVTQYNNDGINQFSINRVVDVMSMGNLVYFDPDLHHEEEWTDEQLADHFEQDFTALAIANEFKYEVQDRYKIMLKNDGTVVRDTTTFTYVSDGNNLESYIMITASKVEGAYDTIYSYDGDESYEISGVEIIVGGYPSESKEDYYDLLIADFYVDETYFRVISSNVTNEIFVKTVELLLE